MLNEEQIKEVIRLASASAGISYELGCSRGGEDAAWKLEQQIAYADAALEAYLRTIVPPPAPFVPGEAPRKTISQVNAENLDSILAAGQEANTAPLPLVCTFRIAPHGVIAEIKDLAQLPAGTYNVVLISQES